MNPHDRPTRAAGRAATEPLGRARRAYARRAWADAYEALALVRRSWPLEAQDLERLALAAYLIDRDAEYLETLEAAHRAYLDEVRVEQGARCAFWLGLGRALRGEMGPAAGWLARAARLLSAAPELCAERGYLLLPEAEQRLEAGDCAAAQSLAERAAEIGERCADADLVACARHVQGRALLEQGNLSQGTLILDETMISVASGELSPLVTGLVYCSVLEACQRIFLLRRACEWTEALARWCARQPQMTVFRGKCRTHRAEVMQLRGAWDDALKEARGVCRHYATGRQRREAAAGYYRIGEIHRLRGELERAEQAYGQAAARGWDPQPGLSLLRMAQGHEEDALTALARAVETTPDPLARAPLLAASVDVALAAGRADTARCHAEQLVQIASRFGSEALTALADEARGTTLLATDAPSLAVPALRAAFATWQEIDAPYEAARCRVHIGLACRALGDEEAAARELEAARAVFARLGAATDRAKVEALQAGQPSGKNAHGLTERELKVLGLAAAGLSNKSIAARLARSEKTIERHMSNILRKLDVRSRTAATARAIKQNLL